MTPISSMRRWRFIRTAALAAAVVVAVLGGCVDTAKLVEENERVREELLNLGKQVDRLSRRNRELEAELTRVSATPDSLPEAIRANTPHVAEIKIGRLSHARDQDGDGRADTLLVYIRPADGLGRTIQLVGDVGVNAMVLPEDGEAITIGRVNLDPGQVREAYRGGVVGAAHYTVTVPIHVSEGSAAGECLVWASYQDGHTGSRHTGERTVSLRPVAP
jgi:hypothetical protein